MFIACLIFFRGAGARPDGGHTRVIYHEASGSGDGCRDGFGAYWR